MIEKDDIPSLSTLVDLRLGRDHPNSVRNYQKSRSDFIYTLYLEGYSYREISSRLGVDKNMPGRVIRKMKSIELHHFNHGYYAIAEDLACVQMNLLGSLVLHHAGQYKFQLMRVNVKVDVNHISRFQGEYRFLSNFYPCTVFLDDLDYPSVEHAYQAAKTTDDWERVCIRDLPKAGQAKSYGKDFGNTKPIRCNWREINLEIMRDLLLQKFSRTDLRRKLLDTGSHELIEGNNWGDTYWGQCPVGKGENHLGKLLMEVREFYAERKSA